MSDVNFIPAKRLAAKRLKARLHLWAVVAGIYIGLLAVASVAAYAMWPGQDTALAKQLTTVEDQIKQDNGLMLELRKALAQTTAAMETAQAIRGQPDWGRLLAGLSRELGEELVLNRCQLMILAQDGKPLAEARSSESLPSKPLRVLLTEHRHRLVLQGFGRSQESVSQFALRLEGVGLFDRVRLVNSCRQTFLGGQAVAFAVECSF